MPKLQPKLRQSPPPSIPKLFSLVCLLLSWTQFNIKAEILQAGGPPLHNPMEDTSDKVDILPDCQVRAARGECRSNKDFMLEQCAFSCNRKTGEVRVETRMIDEEFYELSAKDEKGKVIGFDRFDGYLTIVVNVAIMCELETYYGYLDHVHSVWPWTIEIIAFPYKQTNSKVDMSKCPPSSPQLTQHTALHIMDEVKINGPDTHPVFKFLKEKFEEETMDESHATFFLVSPDGDMVEGHFGSNYEKLMSHISMHVMTEL